MKDIKQLYYKHFLQHVISSYETDLKQAKPGDCLKITGLALPELTTLIGDIRKVNSNLLVYILSDDLKGSDYISATKLIELRNSASQPLLMLIPAGSRTSAEDSYGDATFRNLNVADLQQSFFEKLVYEIPLHITMRDMRSMIAFMLTRDYSCEQVKTLLEYVTTEGLAEYYWQYYYFNITAPSIKPIQYFPFQSLDSNDRLIRLLRETDIARVALPSYDRDLYFRNKHADDYLIFTDRSQSLLDSFNQFNSQMPGWEKTPEKKQIIEIRHHCYIRHQYFEGRFEYQHRLPYRYIMDFARLMKTNDLSKLKETKEALAQAISNSEGCFNKEIQHNYLLLAGSHTKDPISKSYKRFHLSEFELLVNNTSNLTQYIEYESDSLIFRNNEDQHIQLTVSLDLYEMLKFIQEGFNPSINDLRGRFIELQIFKNLMESKTYNEIIVTKNERQYYIIRLSDDKVIHIEPLKTSASC